MAKWGLLLHSEGTKEQWNRQHWLCTLQWILGFPTLVHGEIKFILHSSWRLRRSKVSKEKCQVYYWFIGICLVKISVWIRDYDFLISRLLRERLSNVGQVILRILLWIFHRGRVGPREKLWRQMRFLMPNFQTSFSRLSLLLFYCPTPPCNPPAKPRPFSVLSGEELRSWFILGYQWLRLANLQFLLKMLTLFTSFSHLKPKKIVNQQVFADLSPVLHLRKNNIER